MTFVRVDETELERLAALDDAALRHVVDEVRAHRRDALARTSFPATVLAQPSAGEMEAAFADVQSAASDAGFGWAEVATRPVHAANLRVVRGVFREVLHLREQLHVVQKRATAERDLRIEADERARAAALESELVRRAWLGNKGKTVQPSGDRRSEAWRAAETRINAAVDAMKDPDAADLAIVLREKLRSEGLDEGLPPLAVVDDRPLDIQAAEARLATTTVGLGSADPNPADLKLVADAMPRSEPVE